MEKFQISCLANMEECSEKGRKADIGHGHCLRRVLKDQ